MPISTTERTFEQEIEWCLVNENGYKKGRPDTYDRDSAMDTIAVIDFIKETQPKEWAKICKNHRDETGVDFIGRLRDELSERGMIDVLRHGVIDLGVSVQLCYFKPGSSMNQTTTALYNKNVLQVTRQVKYNYANENSVDTVILLNGLPIITIELKNQLTGQNYNHAINQYKSDRNPRESLFRFKERALVHFAMDTDEIWMTTKLDRQNTKFIPFNRGMDKGAGNPPVVDDYRTSYLWHEILKKDCLLNILHRFVQVVTDEKSHKEKLIFPRYHQLDVVRFLIDKVRSERSGHNYLIQHSAGSGKSNSIAWLAHHLANLHDANDEVIFHSVIVITDRRVLDKQLQRDIYNMEHKQDVVVCVDKNSKQLTKALAKGKKIIVCTLQKFPFVDVQAISTTGKRFAIIVDEAHSSQTGKASEKLKEVLSDISAQGDDAIEKKLLEYAEKEAKVESERLDSDEELAEEIRREMAVHGQQKNLSFFAFTATPKQKTLEIFGTKDSVGKPAPCHVYSMRQAIEEYFIFNVLENYTTYETYFKIGKKTTDDPRYEKKQANKALGKYMSLHPYNLAQKTEVIVEHFRSQVKSRIGGRAKAMLVTGSRLHAVRYYFEFENYINKMRYTDLGVLVAFSGTVKDDVTGEIKEYTEENLNKFSESELPDRFDSEEYQLLLVAEKYQTGFDQPFLHTMYVDKKLAGVKAVQTLSRINRMCEGKTETFVLDFVNSRGDIELAFKDYYQETGISETTDPNVIYDIKFELDNFMLYTDTEIHNLAKVFFKETKAQTHFDFGKLNSYIDPAVDRYNALSDDQKRMDFKSALAKFLRLYSFLTHIINLEDEKLHKFNAYAKCLIRKLLTEGTRVPDLSNDVTLQYYRIQKISEGSICMVKEDGILYSETHGTKPILPGEQENLSQIIAQLNDRFGTKFTEMDKVLEQFVQDMSADDEMVLRSKNKIDLFKIIYDENIMDIVLNRMNQNKEFCERYLEDKEFREGVDKILLPLVHERLSNI